MIKYYKLASRIGLLFFLVSTSTQVYAQNYLGAITGALDGYMQGRKERDQRDANTDRINSRVRESNNQIRREIELSNRMELFRNDLKRTFSNYEEFRRSKSAVSIYIVPALASCNKLKASLEITSSIAQAYNQNQLRDKWSATDDSFKESFENALRELKRIQREASGISRTLVAGSASSGSSMAIDKSLTISLVEMHALQLGSIHSRHQYELSSLMRCLGSVPQTSETKQWEMYVDVISKFLVEQEVSPDATMLSDLLGRISQDF